MIAYCGDICGLNLACCKDELDERKDEGGARTLTHEDDRTRWNGRMIRIWGWVEETEICLQDVDQGRRE